MMEEQDHLQIKVKFSVVIPVLNEEGNLDALYARLTRVMDGLGESYEVIFIDDGSTDNSFQILKSLHQKNSNIKVIRFTRNFGHHMALTAGLDRCQGENAIMMDADLQDQPEEIPELFAKLQEGFDIIYARRKERRDNFFQVQLSKLYLWGLAKLTNQIVNPEIVSFRILTRKVIDYMNQFGESYRFHGGLVAWLGFPYALVDVEHGRRAAGKTKYSFWKRIMLATEGVISFSDIPLRLIGYFGFLISTISFLLGIYMIIRYLVLDIPVEGYTSIIVSLFFTLGVLLLVLGVIGQYIGRIHIEVKKRPLYVIKDLME